MKNNKAILLLAGFAFFGLALPQAAFAGVTSIKGYSAPDGGQDKFVFDVYVTSQEDYPACSVVATYTDGSPSYSTRGVPTFSTNIKPSKPSVINIDCEGVKASVGFKGNTYPFAGDIYKKVGPAPAKVPTKRPTAVVTKPAATPTVVTSPSPAAEDIAPSDINQDTPLWIQNITFLPLRNFFEKIIRLFGKK